MDAKDTKSNFGKLTIHTSPRYLDEEQTFAAGYLEGKLTAKRIHENYINLHTYFTVTMNASLEEPMNWVREQDAWVRKQCADKVGFSMPPGEQVHDRENKHQKKKFNAYWMAVCLAIRQFDGLVAGYKAAAAAGEAPTLKYDDIFFMESNGDLYDIIDMMDPSQRPSWNGISDDDKDGAEKVFQSIALSGKCSALVKLAPDLSDIFMGHSTWDSYTAMLRIYKHYMFNLTQLKPAAQHMSFSSYPGEVFSDDDFYIMSSKIVVLQTTNKIFNDKLFEKLNPCTVLSWQRVRAANWLADSGEAWAQTFEKKNSGTYNNQYMVVDLKQFEEGSNPKDGLLWVVEQIPGKIVAADMTSTLLMGYWPSMNIPYFPEIYNESGYPDFIDALGKKGQHFSKTTHWLSYATSPRSKIFRRDQSRVSSVDSMKDIMRSNDWEHDPYSEGNSICAICGRGDLRTDFFENRGCYDTKATSYKMAIRMQAEAISGPTRGKDSKLPPFRWSEDAPVHSGQPEVFDFDFELMEPVIY